MRVLRFNVTGQTVTQDPSCDFSGLIPGSERYLQAEFHFSREWDDCVKVASFYSPLGHEYPPQVLDNTNTCMVPNVACANRVFKIVVIGKHPNGLKLKTNRVIVAQNGGT